VRSPKAIPAWSRQFGTALEGRRSGAGRRARQRAGGGRQDRRLHPDYEQTKNALVGPGAISWGNQNNPLFVGDGGPWMPRSTRCWRKWQPVSGY
jgi:hypothetical protein